MRSLQRTCKQTHTHTRTRTRAHLVEAVAKHGQALVAQLLHEPLQQLQLLVRRHAQHQQPDRVRLVLCGGTGRAARRAV
jgi:hypothetical protein